MDEPENPAASLKSPAFGGKECFNRVEGYSDGSIAKMAYANRIATVLSNGTPTLSTKY
jgi:hypothetical protein